MTRRRHPARGRTLVQTSFCDGSDDVAASGKHASTRHGTVGRGANFELRAVKEVYENFRDVIDDDTILSVLESCDYNTEKVTALLCEISAVQPSKAAEQHSGDQHASRNQGTSAQSYSGICPWDFLPMACKLQVIPCLVTLLKPARPSNSCVACHHNEASAIQQEACIQVWEMLSLKDMARAAGTCREFAAQAKETRSELRTLKMPPGDAPRPRNRWTVSHCHGQACMTMRGVVHMGRQLGALRVTLWYLAEPF